MVQELLCNHLVAPIFGSPRAMFCRNLFEFCILRKWSHLEVLQKAWLLPLGHWVAADSTGPKARRKHKSDAVEHVVVSCRCCGGCCGRCRCSSRCSCAWYGWPPGCFESWKAGLETPAAASQSRSQGTGWAGYNFILVCHICAGCIETTSHQICTFILHLSTFVWLKLLWTCIASLASSPFPFHFSPAAGEETPQGVEIGWQAEHPRPDLAPSLEANSSVAWVWVRISTKAWSRWPCHRAFKAWVVAGVSTKAWSGWPCHRAFKAWVLALVYAKAWIGWPCHRVFKNLRLAGWLTLPPLNYMCHWMKRLWLTRMCCSHLRLFPQKTAVSDGFFLSI